MRLAWDGNHRRYAMVLWIVAPEGFGCSVWVSWWVRLDAWGKESEEIFKTREIEKPRR